MSPGHEPHAFKDASKQNASKMLKCEPLERRVKEAQNYTVTSTYAAQDYAGTIAIRREASFSSMTIRT
jgi:hypothetical protein